MFIHRPDPIHPVRVDKPDPVFAEKLLEQFGGATGELSAALTYFTQSFHTEDQGIRDMLQNIATEEFGHLEMVAMMIEQHTKHASRGRRRRPTTARCSPCAAMGRTWWIRAGPPGMRDM
jgi:Mn-containing catalase